MLIGLQNLQVMSKRKKIEKISQHKAWQTEPLTPEEREVMRRYKLKPEHGAFVVGPIYEAGGRRDVTEQEMDILRPLSTKLGVNLVVLEKHHTP